MPVETCRPIISSFITPKAEEKKWIKKVEYGKWKGVFIGKSFAAIKDQKTLYKRVKEADVVIYEVHGGGFRLGTATMFMDIFIKWIQLLKQKHNLNAVILSLEYTLAPEASYPVPVLESVAAYSYLVDTLKVPPSKIIISGDSAGGAIVNETLIRVYAPGILDDLQAQRTNFKLELPAGLFLASPLIVCNTNEWSWEVCKEDLITPNLVTCVLKEYLRLPDTLPEELKLLRLAHVRSGFENFVPKNVLIYYGSKEVMRTGIKKITDAMQESTSLNVTVRSEELYHDWYFLRVIAKNRHKHILDDADDHFVSFAAFAIKNYTKDI